jgi:hypothetical protein
MTNYLKELIAQAEKHGFAIGFPIVMSGPESELVGNAFFLDPSQTIRHFIKFEYFAALLANRALRLRPLNRFDDDPNEGKLSQANATGSSSFGTQLAQQWETNPETDGWKQFINGTQRTLIYVHCWFGQEEEDKAMWSRYGNGGRGICLKTSVQRLEESMQSPLPSRPQLGKVTYLDESVAIPTMISSLAAYRKSPQFAHEKECRIVHELSFEECPKTPDGEFLSPPDHLMVAVDLDRLIETVVVGPNTDDDFFTRTEAIIKAAGLTCAARRSQLASPT